MTPQRERWAAGYAQSDWAGQRASCHALREARVRARDRVGMLSAAHRLRCADGGHQGSSDEHLRVGAASRDGRSGRGDGRTRDRRHDEAVRGRERQKEKRGHDAHCRTRQIRRSEKLRGAGDATCNGRTDRINGRTDRTTEGRTDASGGGPRVAPRVDTGISDVQPMEGPCFFV